MDDRDADGRSLCPRASKRGPPAITKRKSLLGLQESILPGWTKCGGCLLRTAMGIPCPPLRRPPPISTMPKRLTSFRRKCQKSTRPKCEWFSKDHENCLLNFMCDGEPRERFPLKIHGGQPWGARCRYCPVACRFAASSENVVESRDKHLRRTCEVVS